MELSEAQEIHNMITSNIKGLYLSGSLRRKEKYINDLDYITKRNLTDVIEDFLNTFEDALVEKKGDLYCRIYISDDDIIKGFLAVDIWRAMDEYEYKMLKIMRKEDKGHNIGLRNKAKDKGMILSDRKLKKGNIVIAVENKKQLYNILNE